LNQRSCVSTLDVIVGAAVCAAALVGSPSRAVPPLVQLPGTAACVSDDGSGGACIDGDVLVGPVAAAVAPDGRMVYVTSVLSDAIVAFDRDLATGALTPKQGASLCVSETGSGGLCVDGAGLDGPTAIAISPDGRHVYVGTITSAAVTALSRDVGTGALAPVGCISESGTGGCSDGRGLFDAVAVAVSSDGRNVYVTGENNNTIAIFDRNVATGALTQPAGTAGCVNDDGSDGCANGVALLSVSGVAVSPDGRHVYGAAQQSNAVTVFDRNTGTGALTQKGGTDACVSSDGTGGLCTIGRGLGGAIRLTVSPDGKTVYVSSAGDDAIAVFDRNVSTGVLTQKAGAAGCFKRVGGTCTDVDLIVGPRQVVVSADGLSVYLAAASTGVLVFDRNPTDGTLALKAGVAACVSDTGTGGLCTDAVALANPGGLAISPDTRSLYVMGGAVSVFTRSVPPYDVDGDGEIEPLKDGLLMLRFAFGFSNGALIEDAVDLVNCTRCTAPMIEAYLEALASP